MPNWIKYLLNASIILTLSIAAFLLGHSPEAPARASGGGIPQNFIFAEDTSDDYVEEVYSESSEVIGPNFFLDSHWNPFFTATGDGGPNQGDSLTLTWSIVPDGTYMPQQFGQDSGCNSSLITNLNAIYGAGNWQNEIANVFTDWASKTGNIYVFEPNDDGADWPTSPGTLGVRGDIRIGGCTVDGNSGILAYNFFPNNGDMKIDATDSWYTTATLTTAFHNVISHEHGHGAGVEHVCPINQTKLMEPFVTTAFKGLQHDDIRAIQRHHGDRNELIDADNDAFVRATDLGTPPPNAAVDMQGVSIDDNSDTDWFKFNAGTGDTVDVTVTPIGSTYPNAKQNSNGSCPAGAPFNSLAVHNLGFEIINSNGTTVLATGNASPAGISEALTGISLGTAGTKYIRVFGDSTDDIQLYDLQMTVRPANIDITKTASSNLVVTGQPLTYTLTITNVSFITLTNVVITDIVPNNTTFNSASDGGGEAGNTVSWPTVSELGPTVSLTRTFSVTLATGLNDGSTIANTAYISASHIVAVQPSNTVATTVIAPVLTATITSNPNPIMASTAMITYTLTVHNIGGAAATNVVLTNTIPVSTTFAWASDGGSEVFTRVIAWPPTTINANSSIMRTFLVTVTGTITDGNQLVNILSATSNEGPSINQYSPVEIVGLKLYYLPILTKNN